MSVMLRHMFMGLAVCNLAFASQAATIEPPKAAIKRVSFKKIYALKGHKDIVQSMKMLKNGQLISGSADTTMRIWSMDGSCIKHLYNQAGWINSVEELIDGRVAYRVYALLIVNDKIISGSRDKTVKIWDSISHSCLATIPCAERVYSLAFASKEQYLFVGLAYGNIEVFQLFF